MKKSISEDSAVMLLLMFAMSLVVVTGFIAVKQGHFLERMPLKLQHESFITTSTNHFPEVIHE